MHPLRSRKDLKKTAYYSWVDKTLFLNILNVSKSFLYLKLFTPTSSVIFSCVTSECLLQPWKEFSLHFICLLGM